MTRVVHTSDASEHGRVTHVLDGPVGSSQAGEWVEIVVTPEHTHRILCHGQRELQDVDATGEVRFPDGSVHKPKK